MGANFISTCHKCKVFTLHIRGFGEDCIGHTLPQFYHDHYNCGREKPSNLEVFWDYFDVPEFEDMGYMDVFDKYYATLAEQMGGK